MEIYYLKKEEFLNSIDINSLKKFCDNREFSSEEKYLEHLCGLFLTKFIAKQVYNIKNLITQILESIQNICIQEITKKLWIDITKIL